MYIINYSLFHIILQIHKLLVEWLVDIDQKIQSDDSLLNDLSEKKAKLEKFKTFNRDIDSHKDLVNKLNEKIQDDASLKSKEIEDTLKRYDDIRKTVSDMISVGVKYIIILILFQSLQQYNLSFFLFVLETRGLRQHSHSIQGII